MTSRTGVKLDLNERSEGAPNWALQELQDLKDEQIWRYRDRDTLEQRIAARFGIKQEQVLATNGADEGLLYAFTSLGQSRLIVPRPCFELYAEMGRAWNLNVIPLAMGEAFSIDLEALKQTIAQGEGGLVVLARPNNPTGEQIPYKEMLQLLETAKEHRTFVLVDEAYAEFAEDDMVSTVAVFDNLLILRTFSKAFGLASLRVGYLLSNQDMISKLRRRALPFNIAGPSLALAERALAVDAMDEMRAYARSVSTQRDGLIHRLRKLKVNVTQGQGNYVFMQLTRAKANLLLAAFGQAGVSLRAFPKQPDLEGCLRLSVPSDAGHLVQIIEKALDPKLICLDVDGCLIDTSDSFDAVVETVVKHFTDQDINRAEIYKLRARGGFNDDNHVARELIRQRGKDIPLDDVKSVFRDAYLGTDTQEGLYKKEKVLIKPELLQYLCKNYKVALVTGRNREELVPALELLQLPEDFPAWTIDDVDRGKPDPEGILAAAEQMDARRVWMVGDNPDDVRAGRAAGALPLGVEMGNQEAQRKAGAALILDDINGLEELL